MSWEEARILSRRGFGIGAHGLTHAILTLDYPDRFGYVGYVDFLEYLIDIPLFTPYLRDRG